MLSTSDIEKYLQGTPPPLQEIVLELRNLIASVAPAATEVFHSRGMTYFDQQRGGPVSAGICQIGIYPDHIRLAFIHGAFLTDPSGLLEGDRKYKRFVRIDSYQAAPWDALKKLIVSSFNFDPYTRYTH